MNEDIRNAINEEELENVSGGAEIPGGTMCPKCGKQMIMHCKMIEGVPTPIGYACGACGNRDF